MTAAGMSIVQGSPQSIWMPIRPATTIYVGGIVADDSSAPEEGVIMLPDPTGVAGGTGLDMPLGICIGTNRKNPLFDSTELTEYILSPAAADPHDGASIEYVGVEGPWAKGDPQAMVKVALITPDTVIKAPIRNAAIKTAITLLTVTSQDTGGGTGVGCTSNAADFVGTNDNMQTIYFRTGGAAGSYRHTDSNSSTIHTWDIATRNDINIGDTAVMAPLRCYGLSTVLFDNTTAMWIDANDAPVLAGTTRYCISVVRLDLAEAGKEYAEFRFQPMHFNHVLRATT